MSPLLSVERAASVITTSLAYAIFMAYLSQLKGVNPVDAAAAALVFTPYAIGPVLVAAFRTTTGRGTLYSTAVLVAASPFSNLFFFAALVIAILPRKQVSLIEENLKKAPAPVVPTTVSSDAPASMDKPTSEQTTDQPRIYCPPPHQPIKKPSSVIPPTDPKYAPVVSRPHVEWVRYQTAKEEPIEAIMKKVELSRSTVRKIQYGQYDYLMGPV